MWVTFCLIVENIQTWIKYSWFDELCQELIVSVYRTFQWQIVFFVNSHKTGKEDIFRYRFLNLSYEWLLKPLWNRNIRKSVCSVWEIKHKIRTHSSIVSYQLTEWFPPLKATRNEDGKRNCSNGLTPASVWCHRPWANWDWLRYSGCFEPFFRQTSCQGIGPSAPSGGDDKYRLFLWMNLWTTTARVVNKCGMCIVKSEYTSDKHVY